MSNPINKTSILNYLKEHYSEFKTKYIESDLHKKVDIIREHKNIKPFFLKMIKKDLINV